MAAGTVTIANAQIIVTAVDGAGKVLDTIGVKGASSLQAATVQAAALSNNVNALGNESTRAARAMGNQSAAAELFHKKLGKLLDGTTILTKFFKTFSAFLVGGLIYGAMGAIVSWTTGLFSAGEQAREAAAATKAWQEAIEKLAASDKKVKGGFIETLTGVGMPGGGIEYARSYAREVDALKTKFGALADAYELVQKDAQKWANPGAGPTTIGARAESEFAKLFPETAGIMRDKRAWGESGSDTLFRVLLEQIHQLEVLDPAAALKKVADADAAIDKAQGAAAMSARDMLQQLKEAAKLAGMTPENAAGYSVYQKALGLSKKAGFENPWDVAAAAAKTYREQVVGTIDVELAKRQKLIGLTQQEIEIQQLVATLKGTNYQNSDTELDAIIRKETEHLRLIQAAERQAQVAAGQAGAVGGIPEAIAFGATVGDALRGAALDVAHIMFSDLITRPFTETLTKSLTKGVVEGQAAAANVGLTVVMPPHTLAMEKLALVIPGHIAALYANAGVSAGGGGGVGSLLQVAGSAGGPPGSVGGGPPSGGLPSTFSSVYGGPSSNAGVVVHVHMKVMAIDTQDFKAKITEVRRHLGDTLASELSTHQGLISRTRRASRTRR